VAGVRLDDGDLISNTSISDLVLQRVGEDHAVVLVSYDETSKGVQRRVDPSFSIVPESYSGCQEHQISKVGAVTGSVAAELLDAPDPFLLLLTVATS
jgi:hypothetical protein